MRPQLIQGDVTEILKTLDAESIQCVVTSPPYWGLRDYGKEGQLGLEPTPEKYVESIVEVFRKVKRVLRKDGTLWLNLGDSFLNKKLVGIPWRVALALQADGWYLRSDIIWQKPNPMPEPVKDRPTRSHEHIFLLSKSSKYFYDHDAVREPVKRGTPQAERDYKRMLAGRKEFDGVRKEHQTSKQQNAFVAGDPLKGRNRRDVWTMTTKSYKGAHFATFPEELPEICIKAGTSTAGCCSKCGEPYRRIVEKGDRYTDEIYKGKGTKDYKSAKVQNPSDVKRRVLESMRVKNTIGWEVSCNCNAQKVPCVVLDIFAGSGTTCAVATKLQRNSIGIELNEEYLELARKRCKMENQSLASYL